MAVPAPATGTGTSTGTTALAVASVTGTIVLGSTITGTGVPAGTTVVSGPAGGGAGNYVTSVPTTLAGIALTFTVGSTVAYFPEFTPIVPPPVIGVGGGPPPTFPPPTPPPIGAIPPGVMVGPAIAPAPVPPSLAGVVQPQYKTGSATVPAANGYFPLFTTTFPVPTIVVGTTFMNSGTGQAGKSPPFINTPPPQTPSTAPITLDGFAVIKPPWQMIAPEVAAGALERGVATGEGLTPAEPVLHPSEPPMRPPPHRSTRKPEPPPPTRRGKR